MPHASPRLLDAMAARLRTGPIVIGESHNQIYAREAIVYLICARAVCHLSIEASMIPRAIARSDGQIARDQVTPYYGRFFEVFNPHYSLKRITEIAVARKIPVYCHDMPATLSPLSGLDPNYITHVKTYGLTLPRFPDKLTYMLRSRNDFAARFLRRALGRGVRVLQGLVVLAGDHHTLADECEGADGTIQHFLGIPENRVYHLS